MNDSPVSRLGVWLPYASLLLTLAAFFAGAPAKLSHHLRAVSPMIAENDFRDEPMLFSMPPETRSWRRFNEMNFRTMVAFK